MTKFLLIFIALIRGNFYALDHLWIALHITTLLTYVTKLLLVYYILLTFLYLYLNRDYVKIYLNKHILIKSLLEKIKVHLEFGYLINKHKLNFIKFNLYLLIFIYFCCLNYLVIILFSLLLSYHFFLYKKSFTYKKQAYKIDLAYFILKVYRYVKQSFHTWLLHRKIYKVTINSWLLIIFKLAFFIFILCCISSISNFSTINYLLLPPISSDEIFKLDREYDQLKKKFRENRAEKKKLLQKKTVRVSLEKGSVIKDKSNKIKTLKLRITGIILDQSSTNYKINIEKLFYALTRNKRYINFSKVKSVFIHFLNDNNPIPLHLAVTLKNTTTFEDYYEKISLFMKDHWKPNYLTTTSDDFIVTLYNLDEKQKNMSVNTTKKNEVSLSRGYCTKVSEQNFVELTDPQPVELSKIKKPSIKPLKLSNSVLKKDFYCMDIETMIINQKTQEHLPIAISTYSKNLNKLFLIDVDLFKKNKDKAVEILFKEYIDFMLSLQKDYVIFAHNLGSYDGYFIYKYLIKIVKDKSSLNCLVDNENKFITITLLNNYKDSEGKICKTKLVWKDSLRIFPGTLKSLCKQFNVEGKLSEYKMDYNSISLFDNSILLEEFKNYSMQDSIALYNAMSNAQDLYAREYTIDICDIVSTASLAFKIYRAHFLDEEIPLLTKFEESFIRESYLGGATDYYKATGENLRCYDVNSLYPAAMMFSVPHKVVKKHNDLTGVDVKDFKGFVLARITSPKYIKNPIVAFKHEGKTIYPLGSWVGVYYADYLAKAQSFGYKVELIYGIEFEYKNLFSDYINHFYDIKKNSTGSLRYLAKLKLNSLYGMFGRKSESIECINVKTKDIPMFLMVKVVKNIIDYNNGYSTLICEKNLKSEAIKQLNITLETSISDSYTPTYSNVAIASAITSEAQMHMMDYKNRSDFEVYYTDKYSIFTDKAIPDYLVGSELGQMKNETLDKYGVETISSATFVGLKKYGLRVIDKEGLTRDSSTFAGVPKDTLSFDEVNSIHNGNSLVRNLKDRFNKSFNSLSIKTQSNVKLEISNKRDKDLLNNNYIPKTVNLLEKQEFDSKLVSKLVNRYNRIKNSLTPFEF